MGICFLIPLLHFTMKIRRLVVTAAAIIAIDDLNRSCYFSDRVEISNMEQLELCISAFIEGAMCMFISYDP